MGVWFIAGFCSSLRGEETFLIELAGTARDLRHLSDPALPHFMLAILGKTKGNQLSGAKFSVPIVGRTTRTNLQPGKWVQQLCGLRIACFGGVLLREDVFADKCIQPDSWSSKGIFIGS